MKITLRNYAKKILAGMLVLTLVLQLFQGMRYVLAQKNSTGPDTYTVTLENAARIYISNEIAPTKYPVTLTYTVQKGANQQSTSGMPSGVLATAEPEDTRSPYYGGEGSLIYWTWNRPVTAERTYTFEMSLDAHGVFTYEGQTVKPDGTTTAIGHGYDNPWVTGNVNATHFGIWIGDGPENQNAVLTNVTCVDAAGNDLGVKAKAATGICTVVKDEKANLKEVEYKELTFSDFAYEDKIYNGGMTPLSLGGEAASITNLDRVAFNGSISFLAPTTEQPSTYYPNYDSIAIGTTTAGAWDGLAVMTDGAKLLLVDRTEGINKVLCRVTAEQINADSVVGASIDIRLTFEYVNDTDVKISFSVDGTEYYNQVVTGMAGKLGNCMTVVDYWRPMKIASTYPVTVTPADFGVADDTYTQVNKVSGQLLNMNTRSETILTMKDKFFVADVQFQGDGGTLVIGGKTADTGVMFQKQSTSFVFSEIQEEMGLGSHTLEVSTAGLTSSGDQINLKISFRFLDYDGDGLQDDVRYGVYFNNKLYDNTYFYGIDDAQYCGNYLSIYSDSQDGSVILSSETRKISDRTTRYLLEDFGMKAKEYETYSGTKEIDYHDIAISGKVTIHGDAKIQLLGDSEEPWYQLYIDAETNKLVITSSLCEALQLLFEIEADKQFTFTLTQKVLDADADGQRDDMCVSFWINESMYQNRYYYLLDVLGQTQKQVSITSEQGGAVTIADSVDVDIYNLSNKAETNGYLLAGKGTLTVNDESVKVGDTVTKAGDYTVRCAEFGTYTRKIAMYISGDAHPDDAMDVRDLVAAKKLSEGTVLDTVSGTKAADVNADGIVDVADCDSIAKHLVGKELIKPVEDNFESYDENVMPIGGYFGPYRVTQRNLKDTDVLFAEKYPDKIFDSLTEDIFEKIQKLGINLITYTENNYRYNTSDVIRQLELADKYGIDVYLKDANYSTNKDRLALALSDYIQYDSFKGFAVADEPTIMGYGSNSNHLLSGYKNIASTLNSYCNLIGNINLLPKAWNMMPNGVLDIPELDSTYEKYVEEYLTTYNPKVLSTDYYVFNPDNKAGLGDLFTEGGYFNNLEVMRVNALEHGVAFWNFIGVGGHYDEGAYAPTSNDTPSEGQLLWNVNTSLAYGAKGITYFTLIQPHYMAYEYNNGVLGYDYKRNGLIGADGNETIWYGYAQKANQQIAAVDEVLMHATSRDVLAVGEMAQQKTGKSASQNSLKENGLMSIMAQKGAIAGVFDYRGKTAYYVVNYDYNNAQAVTLTFDGDKQFSVISATKNNQSFGQTCELDLQAGGAALVVVE